MDKDIVGDGARYCAYEEGITVRTRTFADGQIEVSGFNTTHWKTQDPARKFYGIDDPRAHAMPRAKAKRGESENREASEEASVRRARQNIRMKCKQISADRMLTFTTRKNILDKSEFAAIWDTFRRLMRKHKAFSYVAVPEPHPGRGGWHLHVAVHGRVAQWFAIRCWHKAVGGKMNGYVHFPRTKGGHFGKAWDAHSLAAYISKYLGKDVERRELNEKRYWASKGIALPEKQYWGTSMAYSSMYDALKPVLAWLQEVAGIDDLTARINARTGCFWLATGPRFCGPVMPLPLSE